MPNEEERKPPQQPDKRETVKRGYSLKEGAAQDGEILKASGARPSPPPSTEPAPGTSTPINKGADLTEVEHYAARDAGERLTEVERAKPTPPPPPESSEGEG